MSEHHHYTREQLHDLTESLGLTALQASGTHAHDLGLSALLSAYTTIALCNPCCLQECANQAMRVSMMLAQSAAEERARNNGIPVEVSNRVH